MSSQNASTKKVFKIYDVLISRNPNEESFLIKFIKLKASKISSFGLAEHNLPINNVIHFYQNNLNFY